MEVLSPRHRLQAMEVSLLRHHLQAMEVLSPRHHLQATFLDRPPCSLLMVLLRCIKRPFTRSLRVLQRLQTAQPGRPSWQLRLCRLILLCTLLPAQFTWPRRWEPRQLLEAQMFIHLRSLEVLLQPQSHWLRLPWLELLAQALFLKDMPLRWPEEQLQVLFHKDMRLPRLELLPQALFHKHMPLR
jgi:hypothetical protein